MDRAEQIKRIIGRSYIALNERIARLDAEWRESDLSRQAFVEATKEKREKLRKSEAIARKWQKSRLAALGPAPVEPFRTPEQLRAEIAVYG